MSNLTTWTNVRSVVPAEILVEAYKEYTEQAFSLEGLPELLPPAVTEHLVTFEPELEIPSEVQDLYRHIGRPTSLFRARRLEAFLNTRCRLYFKREDVLPTGSFKINATLPQAFYASRSGIRHVFTDTAAGQTGVATAMAARMLGLECTVFMVGTSYDQKRNRCLLMEMFGAEVVRSPSDRTDIGRRVRNGGDADANQAIALSECTESVLNTDAACTISGSFTDAALTYNTVIGKEAIDQLTGIGERPDVVIGCVGGGSSYGGLALPFAGDSAISLIAVEPAEIPTMTQGTYEYDYPDAFGLLPKVRMYTLGHGFMPPDIHTSGLRYHGCSPVLSALIESGRLEARAIEEQEALAAGLEFTRLEGIIPAPEAAYCIAGVMAEARQRRDGVILSLITGNGSLDVGAYAKVMKVHA